jgi:hypothetical protein
VGRCTPHHDAKQTAINLSRAANGQPSADPASSANPAALSKAKVGLSGNLLTW